MRKVVTLTAVFALVAAAPAWAQWFENFDTGIPATWTVIDNSVGGAAPWDTNVFWGDDNYTDPDGLNDTMCAEANSDVPGGAVTVDTELISPEFVVPIGASLEFDTNYQSYTNLDFADTDISLDGGVSWINLLHWVPPDDEQGVWWGTGAHISTSLADYAGENAQLRFHYYDANWEWYWQLDNVEVTPEPGSLALFGLGALALLRRR